MPVFEPFVRWAGGKAWLTQYLPEIVGNRVFEHYHEPFLGGGAVFFALPHNKKSYLSDANPQLINCYIQIKSDPEKVIECIKKLENTEENYYRVRDEFSCEKTAENAARFIFLNQTSYNGLFRVNRDGRYNVPYGFRKSWEISPEKILLASEKLRNTRIDVGDFEINKYRIKSGDLVFLDPPYTVSHNNNGFIQYNQKLFSLEDQYRLKQFIEYIKRKKAFYVLTNAAHDTIREIFYSEEERMIELRRGNHIGGKNAVRSAVAEYIFTNIPEESHE